MHVPASARELLVVPVRRPGALSSRCLHASAATQEDSILLSRRLSRSRKTSWRHPAKCSFLDRLQVYAFSTSTSVNEGLLLVVLL